MAYVGTGAISLVQNNSLTKIWGAAYKWMFPLHTQSTQQMSVLSQ